MAEKEQKNQEMQILEQNVQSLMFQKQAFQMELSETQAAMKEMANSEEVYKIVGQLMVKSDAKKIKEELESKEKLLDLRIKSLDKQESEFLEKLEELKKEVL